MLDQATRKFDKRIHAGFKYIRGTKDMDILKINDLSKEIWEQLKTIAGKGSDLAQISIHRPTWWILRGVPCCGWDLDPPRWKGVRCGSCPPL